MSGSPSALPLGDLSCAPAGVEADEDAMEGERERAGGGCKSAVAENGEPKKACVLLPLACEDGEEGDNGGCMSDKPDDVEEDVRMLR